MVDLKSLSTFVRVAQLQSFRRAASKLNTTQPAVSQRIQQLEDNLGVKLLSRDRRTVALTDAGRVVLNYAERMLRLRSEMIATVSDPLHIRGSLRLGVAETIVHTWLPRFLEQMNAGYPGIALEIEVDISPNLRDRLLGQQIDLAFMVGPVSAPTIRNRELCRERLGFFASPKLGLRGKNVPLQKIVEHPIVTFSKNTKPFVDVKELLSDPALPLTRIHASASVATIVRMALDGVGIAILPASIVATELKSKTLREIDCAARIPDLRFIAGWLAAPDTGFIPGVVDIACASAKAQTKSLPRRLDKNV
jgi:DNA-binding transcriptional LysR family regulator